jgi:dTDP-4-amino-4,6-dideoxygalactose transaminase
MGRKKIIRRQAIAAGSAGIIGSMIKPFGINSSLQQKLALNGGQKIHEGGWPQWPVWDQTAEADILEMLRSGKWWKGNGGALPEFEKQFAELMGSRRCLLTSSGTTAHQISLHALGVEAGDEVLTSAYTFRASYDVIFMANALPVFIDTDPETFVMDTSGLEKNINERTKAILPVHINGLPVDMDAVISVARKHNLKVNEDACQANLAEYKGRKVGSISDLGCFSFQNSKQIPAGEGGAIIGSDDETMDRCYAYCDCDRVADKSRSGSHKPSWAGNYRMQQSQALILLSQIKRAENDFNTRWENAQYLRSKLKDIPGIVPYKLASGATKAACYLYPLRYQQEKFGNVPKELFVKALVAEGIPCNGGTTSSEKGLTKIQEDLIERAFNSKAYNKLYPGARLKQWRDETILPGSASAYREVVNFSQNVLLGSRNDMDDIVRAITRIYENRSTLKG